MNIDAFEFEKGLDRLLQQPLGYKKAIEFLLSSQLQSLIEKNQNIYILHIMAIIANWEMSQNVEHHLFAGRTVKEIIQLYRMLSLYLRRIEFDLPLEYRREIVDYIISEKISTEAVLAVIQMNKSIICKDEVTDGLRKLLNELTNNQ